MIADLDDQARTSRYSLEIMLRPSDLWTAVREGRCFDYTNPQAYLLQMVELLKQKAATQ